MSERTIRTVGSVFTFTDMREVVPFVVTKYIDHNKGDWGACCNDEIFYYIPVDSLERLIETEGSTLSYNRLVSLSGYKRFIGKTPNMELLPNEAPFCLEVFKAVNIRRMKAKTITTVVYE